MPRRATIVAAAKCGRSTSSVLELRDGFAAEYLGRRLGGSKLRPPLSWLELAARHETAGFHLQLNAAAAITAQLKQGLPRFKTLPWVQIEIRTQKRTNLSV